MKKITALLFPLLLSITDVGCYQLPEDQGRKKAPFMSNANFGEETAKVQVKTIFDLFQFFQKQTIEKFHAEWIRKQRPFETASEIINFANITFTKFIPDDEILPISRLTEVDCEFGRSLEVHFDPRKYSTNIEGNAKFSHPKNFSLCQVFFNFDLIRVLVEFIMENSNMTNKSVEIIYPNILQNTIKNFKMMKLEDESCLWGTNRKQIANYTDQAINNIIKRRLKIIAKSVFESMFNKCLNSKLEEKSESYSLFKLEPSLDEFPWNSDYNELNITGLNHISHLKVRFLNPMRTYCGVYIYNVNIQRDVVSMTTQKTTVNIHLIELCVDINMPTDYAEVDLETIGEKRSDNHILQDPKIYAMYTNKMGVKNSGISINIPAICYRLTQCSHDLSEAEVKERNLLGKLMLAGVEQTFQKIRYDGTQDFTNTFHNILAPFDGRIFETLLKYFEKMSHKNSFASFSNIKMETYENLENITCKTSDNGSEKIGTISYKNIKARANFTYNTTTYDGYKMKETKFADVYIKELNFDISLQRLYQNQTNKITAIIEDNFEISNKMITLNDNFPHKIRITTGQQIFGDFIKLFREQINDIVNSAFHPFFNACTREDLLRSINEPNSNYFSNPRQYFAFIRGHSVESTHLISSIQSVDVLINGTWNFKDIKARYVNGNLIFDGLQMENATGSMKLWKKSNESAILDYETSLLSLIIDHENTAVKVKVARGLNLSNASYFNSNKNKVSEIFETTVAFFIAQSIYGDSMNYHRKFRTLVNKTMIEAVQKKYDATSVFADNIVKTLKDIPSKAIYDLPEEISLELEKESTSFNLSILPSRIFIDFEYPINAEEICGDFDYSQNVRRFVENFTLFGNITIRNGSSSGNELSRVYFEAVNYRKGNISNNENEYSDQWQIYIYENTMIINGIFESYNKDILKEKFTQIASEFVNQHHGERFPSTPNICLHRFGNLEPSENHFFLVTNTINTVSQHLLIHHIKLYGLYNFYNIGYRFNDGKHLASGFVIKGNNLTAHILWNYYIGNSFSKIPREIKLQIDEITLEGRINNRYKILAFETEYSTLQFSHDTRISPRFQNILTREIIDSIKNLVIKGYFRDDLPTKNGYQ